TPAATTTTPRIALSTPAAQLSAAAAAAPSLSNSAASTPKANSSMIQPVTPTPSSMTSLGPIRLYSIQEDGLRVKMTAKEDELCFEEEMTGRKFSVYISPFVVTKYPTKILIQQFRCDTEWYRIECDTQTMTTVCSQVNRAFSPFVEWPSGNGTTMMQQKNKGRKKMKNSYNLKMKGEMPSSGVKVVYFVKRWTLIGSKNVRANLKMVKVVASVGKLKLIGLTTEGTNVIDTDKYIAREHNGLFYLEVREERGLSRFLLETFHPEMNFDLSKAIDFAFHPFYEWTRKDRSRMLIRALDAPLLATSHKPMKKEPGDDDGELKWVETVELWKAIGEEVVTTRPELLKIEARKDSLTFINQETYIEMSVWTGQMDSTIRRTQTLFDFVCMVQLNVSEMRYIFKVEKSQAKALSEVIEHAWSKGAKWSTDDAVMVEVNKKLNERKSRPTALVRKSTVGTPTVPTRIS
ncbi:hypothetical protein PFISCL1PPCAC_10909, partial [Pristionchus fissidentatus]